MIVEDGLHAQVGGLSSGKAFASSALSVGHLRGGLVPLPNVDSDVGKSPQCGHLPSLSQRVFRCIFQSIIYTRIGLELRKTGNV